MLTIRNLVTALFFCLAVAACGEDPETGSVTVIIGSGDAGPADYQPPEEQDAGIKPQG